MQVFKALLKSGRLHEEIIATRASPLILLFAVFGSAKSVT